VTRFFFLQGCSPHFSQEGPRDREFSCGVGVLSIRGHESVTPEQEQCRERVQADQRRCRSSRPRRSTFRLAGCLPVYIPKENELCKAPKSSMKEPTCSRCVGPTLEFLILPEEADSAYCVMTGTMPPGVSVPLHSHPDIGSCFFGLGSRPGNLSTRWEVRMAGCEARRVCSRPEECETPRASQLCN
jgi:hypothetical protein